MNVNAEITGRLRQLLNEVSDGNDAEVLSIHSPIRPGLEDVVRNIVHHHVKKQPIIAIILETPGGHVEVVERMVGAIRHHYEEVWFLILGRAMSAGTVFAMSGDRIYMDYHSCLGPIDPQIERDGKLIPGLAYINKFNELRELSKEGKLTPADYALIEKFDPGELEQFSRARDLSVELLERWLSKYKFKDWMKDGKEVTDSIKQKRAKEIGEVLSDMNHWKSHGRGIRKETLEGKEIDLRINDLDEVKKQQSLQNYFNLLRDYMGANRYNTCVQTVQNAFFH